MTYEPKLSEWVGEGDDAVFQTRMREGQYVSYPNVIFDLMHEGNPPKPEVETGPTGSSPATIYEPSGPVLEEMSLKQVKETLSEVRELQQKLRLMVTALGLVERKLVNPTGLPEANPFAAMFGAQPTTHRTVDKDI